MTRLAAVLGLVAACAAGPTFEPERPDVESHVIALDYFEHRPQNIDVLFVVDTSAAMAPYVSRLPAIADAFAHHIDPTGDLHVAVTSADPAAGGALRTAEVINNASIVVDTNETYDTRTTNYVRGSLADAIAELLGGDTSGGAPEPFRAARLALPGVVRTGSDAFVLVTILAGDDASPSSIADFAALRAQLPLSRISTVAIYPVGDAPNLDAISAAPPSFAGSSGPIAGATFDAAFGAAEGLVLSTLEGRCMPVAAHDCSAERVSTDITGTPRSEIIPACPATAADGRCWDQVVTGECSSAVDVTPRIEHDTGRERGLRLQCTVAD